MNEYEAAIYEQVHTDYLRGIETPKVLAAKWNITERQLLDWITESHEGQKPWKIEKTELEKRLRQSAIELAQKDLTKALTLGAGVVSKLLKNIDKALSEDRYLPEQYPDLLSKVASIMPKLQGVLNISLGQPTAHVTVESKQLKVDLTDEMHKLKRAGFVGGIELVADTHET